MFGHFSLTVAFSADEGKLSMGLGVIYQTESRRHAYVPDAVAQVIYDFCNC